MDSPRTDYRRVLHELITMWNDEAQLPSITVRTDVPPVVVACVRGLVAHAVDAARGVHLLYQNSQPVAAVPLVRCVLEDAVTAQWVLATPDGWKAVLSENARQTQNALNEIVRLDLSTDSARIADRLRELAVLKDSVENDLSYKVIEQRFQALQGTDALYLMYRSLSGDTHAGVGVIDFYLVADDASPMGASFTPTARQPVASNYLGIATVMLIHALMAWDSLTVTHAMNERLVALALKMGVRTSLAPLRSAAPASEAATSR